jgi:hypothetical protein
MDAGSLHTIYSNGIKSCSSTTLTFCDARLKKQKGNTHSKSRPLLCYRIICTRSGPCRRRCRLFNALAAHKNTIREIVTQARMAIRSASGSGERGLWQRRFWEHLIRDDADYARHIEYCYIDPLKHGLVRRVQDWPHSSFHRDVRRGIFPLDWAGEVQARGEFGERK